MFWTIFGAVFAALCIFNSLEKGDLWGIVCPLLAIGFVWLFGWTGIVTVAVIGMAFCVCYFLFWPVVKDIFKEITEAVSALSKKLRTTFNVD